MAQAAWPSRNARLYGETRGRLEESRALLEVAEILNSTLDSSGCCASVTMKIAQGAGRSVLHPALGRGPPGR